MGVVSKFGRGTGHRVGTSVLGALCLCNMAAYTGVLGKFISDDLVRRLFEGALLM
jgi:hypothetical protein